MVQGLCPDTMLTSRHLPLQAAHSAVHIVEDLHSRVLLVRCGITGRLQRVDDGCELLHDTFAVPSRAFQGFIRYLRLQTTFVVAFKGMHPWDARRHGQLRTSLQNRIRHSLPAATASLSSLHLPFQLRVSHHGHFCFRNRSTAGWAPMWREVRAPRWQPVLF
jgi:hypothetical protein